VIFLLEDRGISTAGLPHAFRSDVLSAFGSWKAAWDWHDAHLNVCVISICSFAITGNERQPDAFRSPEGCFVNGGTKYRPVRLSRALLSAEHEAAALDHGAATPEIDLWSSVVKLIPQPLHSKT